MQAQTASLRARAWLEMALIFDVGAPKQTHIGVALIDGMPEDLQNIRRSSGSTRRVYESQLKILVGFGQVPPPAIAHLYPDESTGCALEESNGESCICRSCEGSLADDI